MLTDLHRESCRRKRVASLRVCPLSKGKGVGLGKGRGDRPNLEKATKHHQELVAPARFGLGLQIKTICLAPGKPLFCIIA